MFHFASKGGYYLSAAFIQDRAYYTVCSFQCYLSNGINTYRGCSWYQNVAHLSVNLL